MKKVECPNCKAVHRIDESKLPENGAYGRCRECKSRFFIGKNEPHQKESEKEKYSRQETKKTERCPK